MKLKSTGTFWPLKDAMEMSYPSLESNIKTPILIIGGGITGALTAYKLITEGKKAVIIDRRDICNGSTAASTALLQYEIDVPLHELIKLRGLKCAVDSYQNGINAIYDLKKIVAEIKSDCHFELKKSIYFCSVKKHIPFLENEFSSRKENGLKVKWLDKNDLKKLGLNALAAIQSETAAVMDPYRFALDLLLYCTKKGLQIYDRTNITKISHQDDTFVVTTDTDFEITAHHVIHCSGYESTETLKEKVVDLKSTFVITSETIPDLPNDFTNYIFWDTSEPYLYFRATADNRIIMGGGDEDFKTPEKRDEMLPKKEHYLLKQFQKKFPDLNFKIDYSWAGTFGETKDGLPYFGKPDSKKNEHYILGFGGNGITFSVIGLNSILASIENKQHPDLEYYKFHR
ncbi:FAD-dependent oxidoreductase [Flavobacterium piscis]|uniref:Glycine/D-amino acid oxidase-like deaminating enzyme n=1 Tax=Flavobacterium piscis TaxID=1114874 RepID=A0ABU1YDP2_9FLAO|nr:FAD-dependent oxidoreductase [Flavobacterium piscis]MDR7212362.1 glycine/D-amino acid oxidase-like deaminating enzyme [Flavobacterium piscis]